jgi:hypothetical protein
MPRVKVKIEFVLLLSLVSSVVSAEVNSLCDKHENVVWSCQVKNKIYSICSSKDLTETKGYLQYRAGIKESTEFKYPELLQNPKGRFQYGLLPHGAVLIFKNGIYTYSISEDLIGQPVISVEKREKYISTIQCDNSTQSLTNNETMDIFKTIGAYQ